MGGAILIVDDDELILETYRDLLERNNFNVLTARSGEEAKSLIKRDTYQVSVAVVDFFMPNGLNGAETITELHKLDSRIHFVGLSGNDSDTPFVHSLSAGAIVFIQKGLSSDKFLQQIKAIALKYENSHGTIKVPAKKSASAEILEEVKIVGASASLIEVVALAKKFGEKDVTILIRGENGTGKEKIARAIHHFSRVSKGPFVAVNCAAIPENLIESELFGHEKGAFTGAVHSKIGLFQQAHNGTIFLDEIGDMPLHLQVKLLRIVQDRQITPVGSIKTSFVNVRIVAATNQNLEMMINEGKFRMDLYHRINAATIVIPPLRDRIEDIEPLTAYILENFNLKNGSMRKFHNNTMRHLQQYPWPGNIRELENVIQRILIESDSETITEADILKQLDIAITKLKAPEKISSWENLKVLSEKAEREMLLKIVTASSSLTEVASKLNISRSTLREKMKVLNIEMI